MERLLIKDENQGGQPEIEEELVENFNKDMVNKYAEPLVDEEAEGVDARMCEVCYLTYKKEDFFGLDCKHEFCVNCTTQHLQITIGDVGNALKLPCM